MKLKKDIILIAKALKEIHVVQKGVLAITVVKAFVDALLPFVTIYLSAIIVDGIVAHRDFKQLLGITIFSVTVSFLLLMLSRILRCSFHVSLRTKYNMKKDMHEAKKMFDMDYADMESSRVHKLLQKRKDLAKFNGADISFYAYRLTSVVTNFLKIIFSFAMTFELFWRTKELPGLVGFICSGWGSICFAAAIFLVTFLQMYCSSRNTSLINKQLNRLAGFTRIISYYQDEMLSTYKGGKDIRLYGMQPIVEHDILKNTQKIRTPLLDAEKVASCYMLMITVAETILNLFIYLFVGIKASSGIFTIGVVIRQINSIKAFSGAFSGFMKDISAMRSRTDAIELYFKYMNMPTKGESVGGMPMAEADAYEIEFQNVSFQYPNTKKYALCHVNITISKGEHLAIVGLNGSGKTTFIKLLCRLYEPCEGRILLDGVDIRNYKYDEYLDKLAVVFQDFKIFSFMLGQNVAGNYEVNRDLAIECLRNAGFGERLDQMEKGIDTYLYHDFETDGMEVSGGEAQKIALARALYKNAPIVILDEPTAALDPVSEYDIYIRFNRMVEKKTAIYISHRLSSCRFCDKIVVFEEGRIVQVGTHEELVQDNEGLYFRLWNAQAQYYD